MRDIAGVPEAVGQAKVTAFSWLPMGRDVLPRNFLVTCVCSALFLPQAALERLLETKPQKQETERGSVFN